MPSSRPAFTLKGGGTAGTFTAQVSGGVLTVIAAGGGAPQYTTAINLTTGMALYLGNDISMKSLQAIIAANCVATTFVMNADCANYNLAKWLDATGVVDIKGIDAPFNMTTAYVTKNPTLPAVGKVTDDTTFGDNNESTGTINIAAVEAAAAAAQLVTDEAAVDADKASIKNDTTILGILGTLDTEADNPADVDVRIGVSNGGSTGTLIVPRRANY